MGLKVILKYIDNRPNIENGVGRFIDRAVRRSVKVMERNIKVNTPYKDGHLRRSIMSRDISFGESEVYNELVEGGKPVNYAVYQEFGTKYIAPRAMFRKGVGVSKKKIQDIFKEEAKKVDDKMKGK